MKRLVLWIGAIACAIPNSALSCHVKYIEDLRSFSYTWDVDKLSSPLFWNLSCHSSTTDSGWDALGAICSVVSSMFNRYYLSCMMISPWLASTDSSCLLFGLMMCTTLSESTAARLWLRLPCRVFKSFSLSFMLIATSSGPSNETLHSVGDSTGEHADDDTIFSTASLESWLVLSTSDGGCFGIDFTIATNCRTNIQTIKLDIKFEYFIKIYNLQGFQRNWIPNNLDHFLLLAKWT